MFEFFSKMFIELLSLSGYLATKYMSLNNELINNVTYSWNPPSPLITLSHLEGTKFFAAKGEKT